MKDRDVEVITRKFCENRGIDPDAWKAYEETVREGIALIEAIGSAETNGNKCRG